MIAFIKWIIIIVFCFTISVIIYIKIDTIIDVRKTTHSVYQDIKDGVRKDDYIGVDNKPTANSANK